MKKLNIAVVGATGLVGQHFLKILEEKNIKINNLFLFASKKSAGKKVVFKNQEFTVLNLSKENVLNKKIDYVLFSAGSEISILFAPVFNSIGATVIDNSSAFRMDKNVPLVVPQVNPEKVLLESKIIANPNCSTIACMAPLKVLDNLFKLKRVHFATYQAVSGSGQKGLNDLENNKQGLQSTFYPYQIFENIIPHIDKFLENGFTKEEMKMINESQKILNLKTLKVSATCVRVPTKFSHCVDITAKLENNVDLKKFALALQNFESVVLCDNPQKNIYPMPITSTGTDNIFVGRIRQDIFSKKIIHFFVCADNIRKGAASNAIEILELLEKKKHLKN